MADADAVADIESRSVLVDTVEILDRLDLGHPNRADRDGVAGERVLDRDGQPAVAYLAEGDLVEVAIRAEDVAVPELHERTRLGAGHRRQPRGSGSARTSRDPADVDGLGIVVAAAVDE